MLFLKGLLSLLSFNYVEYQGFHVGFCGSKAQRISASHVAKKILEASHNFFANPLLTSFQATK